MIAYRVEYVTNSDHSWAIRDLETRVGHWKQQGWEPLGGVSIATIPNPDQWDGLPYVLAAQALIKPDPPIPLEEFDRAKAHAAQQRDELIQKGIIRPTDQDMEEMQTMLDEVGEEIEKRKK